MTNYYFVLAGQFTQIVWKETRTFGIGYAEYELPDQQGFVKTIVVAQYYPGGNKQGQFKDNVQPPIADINNPSKLLKLLRKHHKKKTKKLEAL